MAINLCKYNKICTVYQGAENVHETALAIHKNVFCNRGFKGWNNCEQYIEYNTQTLNKRRQNE